MLLRISESDIRRNFACDMRRDILQRAKRVVGYFPIGIHEENVFVGQRSGPTRIPRGLYKFLGNIATEGSVSLRNPHIYMYPLAPQMIE